MSSRQKDRDPFGDYPTPGWCVDRLVEHLGWTASTFAGSTWLEPCAGAGGIIRRVNTLLGPGAPTWHAWELQAKYTEPLTQLGLFSTSTGIDAVKMAEQMGRELEELKQQRRLVGRLPIVRKPFDCIITNPPFELAMPLILALQPLTDCLILLLRVNFLASEKRHEYWTAGGMPETIYQLPDRPKFRNGKADSTEYGWWRWGTDRVKVTSTRIELLPLTPTEERNLWENPDGRRRRKAGARARVQVASA